MGFTILHIHHKVRCRKKKRIAKEIFVRYVREFHFLDRHRFHQLPYDNRPEKEIKIK
jgi:hypothetical protein